MRTMNRIMYRDRPGREISMQVNLQEIVTLYPSWGPATLHVTRASGAVQTVSNGVRLSATGLQFVNPHYAFAADGSPVALN